MKEDPALFCYSISVIPQSLFNKTVLILNSQYWDGHFNKPIKINVINVFHLFACTES